MRKVKLSDLCIESEIGKYGIPASAEAYDKNKVRYLRISDIDDLGNLINTDRKSISSDEIEKYILKEGEIVFARTGNSTGRTYFHEDKNGILAFAGFLIKFGLDKRKVNPKYLKYYTISDEYKSWVNNLSVGSTRGNINAQTFAGCPILLPERKQQDFLVKILSVIDDKIEVLHQINDNLAELAKTIYDYWFVQFDFPDENGKPYKSSGGKMVYNEVLKREIPEGWEVKRLGEILKKNETTIKINAKDYLSSGSIPIIDQSSDFICGYTNEISALIKASNIPAIIFGDHTRILKFIDFDFARGADGTQILFSNNEKMPQYLFYHSLLKIDLSNYGYARHFKFLKEQKILLSDRLIAEKFTDNVKTIYEKIKINRNQIQHLQSLRDWLLPMLMNGQISVE